MKKKVFSLMMTLLLAVFVPGAMFAQNSDAPSTQGTLHTYATYGVGDNAQEFVDMLLIERPNNAWMEPYHFNLYNEGTTSVEVVLIDFLHNNGYFRMEGTTYPFTVAPTGRPGVDLYINTNTTWTSVDAIESMLAVNTTEGPRSTHLYDIVALPYQPYCPDVWEKAYNIGEITTGTTWSMYTAEMWEEVNPEPEYNLHPNYDMPDFEENIPDGYDAVMKFTADHDIMLNAYVSDGENGKVALYRQDFAGRPGPMADNNYTMRPFHAVVYDNNRDEFTYSFDNGLDGWTTIDADGDGHNWYHDSEAYNNHEISAGTPHSGAGCLYGESFCNYWIEALTPDDYLVSPQKYAIGTGASVSLWASARDEFYAAEHFGVFVSTGNATPGNFTEVASWTLGAKSGARGPRSNRDQGAWHNFTCDLSAYAGQEVWIAIRHWNCSDEFIIMLDDVTINTGAGSTPDVPTPDDPETSSNFSAGPVIQGLNVLKGTYYLVASSTDPNFQVTINFEELPCPIEAVTNIYPHDNDSAVLPQNLVLRWKLNDYANEWRLVFSSTYWPEDEIDTEHPATYVTEWSSDLQESFNISAALEANGYHLWNNTNYFWRIEQRHNPGMGEPAECYTPGPIFGFTTTFNVPQNVTVDEEYISEVTPLGTVVAQIFEYENVVTLTWNPVVDRNNDRTYRRYRIYKDGVRVHDTPDNVQTTSWVIPQDMLTYNMYNEQGYVFQVTAVYDEGESPVSNSVIIWVSGKGTVSGYVWEQDEVTPIGGVTVTITGTNEFGGDETYTFVTNEDGYYEGSVHAGIYGSAVATMEGYQPANTIHEVPFNVYYDTETEHVDFIMDELFLAPAHVCAEPIYVPGVEGDTLVQVWWDFDFFTEMAENFEDWENSPYTWVNDATYPWALTTSANEGSYALKSGNAGVASSTSELSVTVNIPQDGVFSFDYNCQGEGTSTFWDHCDFVMDGATVFTHGADLSGWHTYSNSITAGPHSFKWSYTKDSSVNPTGDCFTIDNIVFVGHGEDAANTRALHHYNIYRTDCYNDGPYTDENTTFLATVWRPDTSYFDVNWPDVAPGVYKYGVSAVYRGNYPYNPNNPRVEYPDEERESEIVWHTMCKPCIDKDMYLFDEVTINVVMNSADSPEGTKVTFTNTNPGEQYNHPMEPIILGETGFYRFPSFRKGNYNILIEHAGFVTILDYQEIWSAMDLRYVMIEIIYNAQNLYVSRTGWAMWEPFIPDGPGAPDTPDTPTGGGETYSFDFEEDLSGWTNIDNDGDGIEWMMATDLYTGVEGHGANGSDNFVMGISYVNGYGAFDEDNYLVSPQAYALGNGASLSFYHDQLDEDYPDYMEVCVSTAATPAASNFTPIWNNGGSRNGNRQDRNDNVNMNNRFDNWSQVTLDLSAYAGQNVWIAFHHQAYNQYSVLLDNVTINTGGRNRADRHLEGYKVLCTSIDGEPIFNRNTVHPFCQLGTVDPHSGADLLIEGNYYICKVAAIYSTGMSDYISCTWQYEPCEHWAGTANGVTTEGNTVVWDYPGTVPPTPPTGEGDTFTEGFENGIPSSWTTFQGSNGTSWNNWMINTSYTYNTSIHSGYGHNSSNGFVLSESYVSDAETGVGTAVYPDNYLVTPQVTIANGSQLSFWVTDANNSYGAEHFTVEVSTTSNNQASAFTPVFEQTLSDSKKGPRAERSDRDLFNNGVWFNYTVDLSAYAGQQVYIAFHHFNCYDQWFLALDDVDLSINRNRDDVSYGFEGGFEGWTTFQGSNGTSWNNWMLNTSYTYNTSIHSGYGHNSSNGFVLSESYISDAETGVGTAVYPDNYLVSPQVTIANGSQLSFWVTDANNSYGAEHFTVEVSTTSNNQASAFTPVFEQTLSDSKKGPRAERSDRDLFNNGVWFNYTVDLSAYAGQQVYIAFHHFNCYDQWFLALDDVELTGSTTPVDPTPTPAEGILGAMIFVDGEWEAFVEAPTNTYTYEGEGEEICVRIVYDGDNQLPNNNYYYAMSCEECEALNPAPVEPTCEAGDPIFAEVNDVDDQVRIWWGEEPVPFVPMSEWLYYVDEDALENATALGLGGDMTWGIMFPASSLQPYNGCTLTEVALINGFGSDNNPATGTYNVKIYLGGDNAPETLVSTQTITATGVTEWLIGDLATPVALDMTQNLWIVVQSTITYSGVVSTVPVSGDPNASWIFYQDTWQDLSPYGYSDWFIRGFVTNERGGGELVALTDNTAVSEGTLSQMANVNFSNVVFNGNRSDRDGIVSYNIYRSEDGVDYELINNVPANEDNWYEYYDAPEAGTYYYQVTAVYADGCESAPAVSGFDPEVNYVMVGVTGIGENSINVNLFPNPTKGNVTIQAKGMNHITVVSVLGQVVFDTELDQDEYIMNMAQFNTGLYMVRVYTNEGVTVKRVTVMH